MAEQAIRYSKPLEPRKHDRDVHDLGFIFMSTYYRWFRITRIRRSRGRHPGGPHHGPALQGERASICALSSPKIAVHRHHDERRHHLLCGRETGDPRLLDVAMRHASPRAACWCAATAPPRTKASSISKPASFSSRPRTGYRGDSCWSRGLAWSLYGFGTCYGYSAIPRFLQTAEACADYLHPHTPADGVPPWDYDAPPEEAATWWITSAAAIAAAGLFQLGGLSGRSAQGPLLLVDGAAAS